MKIFIFHTLIVVGSLDRLSLGPVEARIRFHLLAATGKREASERRSAFNYSHRECLIFGSKRFRKFLVPFLRPPFASGLHSQIFAHIYMCMTAVN